MADNTQQIATIKSQTLATMVAITENPKPTYNIDGQQVAWGEYLRQLQSTVDWCNTQMAVESPFEIDSRGTT